MKAEISNDGFRRTKSYSGVYQQQGRMLLDRDWNEWISIVLEQQRSISSQSIGTGAPRHGGLLEPDSGHLAIRNQGGLIAAAGVIGEAVRNAKADAAAVFYAAQRDLPQTVRNDDAGGEQPLQAKPEPGIVYADIWERAVTALEDGGLLDVALHGADTCFRTQRMVQLKTAAEGDLDPAADPCNPGFLTGRIPAAGNAEFDIELTTAGEAADECDPCALEVTIERSVANHLFRLEVHSAEFGKNRQPEKLWLKWSNENGAREYRAADFAAEADPNSFSYEFFSTETEHLSGMPSDDWAEAQVLCGALDPANPADAAKFLPRIREWDGWLSLELSGGKWKFNEGRHGGLKIEPGGAGNRICEVKDGSMLLTVNGVAITLTLDGKSFLTGDYWLALGRTRQQGADRLKKISALPVGIRHHYCILGAGTFKETATFFEGLDPFSLRRLQHPSLTCLDAKDIGYKADNCDFLSAATNVQQALDALCKRNHWALRMSAGTGQEGFDGDVLASPIEVLVEDQDGKPVAGAQVRLEAVHPTAGGAPTDLLAAAAAPGAEAASQILTSDADGYVFAFWRIRGAEGVHSVSAALVTAPQGVSGKLWYTATLMPRVKNSQFALIENVVWQDETPYRNDAGFSLATVSAGLVIHLSSAADPQTISNDVLTLTAEFAQNFGGDAGIVFPLVVLCAVVTVVDKTLVVRPDPSALQLVLALHNRAPSLPCTPVEGMRIRLRLIGRFVMTEQGLLDGFVPSSPKGKQINLDFTRPGIGHVSDFESWFYVQLPERRTSIRQVTDADLTTLGFKRERWPRFREAAANAVSMDMFIDKFRPTPDELVIIRQNLEL
jgi:Family of unknown function (DUF6519)